MEQLAEKIKSLIESIPEESMEQFPQDVKIMIVKKFGGQSDEPMDPAVQKILDIVSQLDEPKKMQLMKTLHPKKPCDGDRN